ncbi:Gfo/Idh/MocA family protein [Microlunatus sp. Y2014]|uniref:Gfo/Idh/MocA family protein n=1 Tax=Microlunatus sp. Y2014 TaxID=3418488 RepID=UPI003DA736C8
MTDTLRVGVIGAGGNTRRHHIPKLQAIAGVEVVAVSNRSRASGERVAADFGITTVHDHWWELIADSSLDAIVIGTWPDMHARLTVAALEAGKHVLCEARLARDVAEARTMINASQANPHLVAQVVPAPYTLPFDATISRLLSDRTIGDLVSVEVEERSGFADPTAPVTWRQRTDISGVNVMSLGIHYEAVLRWLGEATRVSAFASTSVRRRPDASDGGTLRTVDVPDHVDVTGALACGAQLRIMISQSTALGPKDAIHLYGTEGTIRLADGVLAVGHRGDTELTPVDIPAEQAIGWRVEEEFVGAVRGTEPVRRTTFDDGLRYLRFTEAVHRSIHERRQVTLSEL